MRKILMFLLLCMTTPAGAQLHFETQKIMFGTMSEDDGPRKFVYNYINESDKPVVILQVETECGCAKPSFLREPIQPREKGQVVVTFHPKGRAGETSKSVYVKISGAKSVTRLSFVGTVEKTKDANAAYPYRIGVLRLKQDRVNFGLVRAGMRTMMRVEVMNEGMRALRLSVAGLPGWLSFKSDPVVIDPGAVGDLVFVCDSQGLDADKQIAAEVILDGVMAPPSERVLPISVSIGKTLKK